TTTPATSQPSTFGWPASGWVLRRTLVSTGLTEMARTSTSRSRGPGTGSGSSTSCSARGSSMARDSKYATAFMLLLRMGSVEGHAQLFDAAEKRGDKRGSFNWILKMLRID